MTLEGRRPLVAEVQALVAPPAGAHPRRAVSGLDPARLAMVLAVIETRLKIKLAQQDVYASTVGGVRLSEPAADLAAVLAVFSAVHQIPLPADLVVLGEVGLAGDIRLCQGIERRLAAAARLGFRRAIVPQGFGQAPGQMVVAEAADLRAAIDGLTRLIAQVLPPADRSSGAAGEVGRLYVPEEGSRSLEAQVRASQRPAS